MIDLINWPKKYAIMTVQKFNVYLKIKLNQYNDKMKKRPYYIMKDLLIYTIYIFFYIKIKMIEYNDKLIKTLLYYETN